MIAKGLSHASAITDAVLQLGQDFRKVKCLTPKSTLEIQHIGIVVIGRNEGKRFEECLAALPKKIPAVYVDSGSTDDSVFHALAFGMQVVHLPLESGFTAARARNTGWRALLDKHPDLKFIQFLDGDCALDQSWLVNASAQIGSIERLGAMFGRLKERFPEHSIYNAMCDHEWDVPVGEVRACGGNALICVEALIEVGGYNNSLIAGEEPDLCLRMRSKGWVIQRIYPKMATHDAAILNFGSWWKRARRAGHAYVEHVVIHGRSANPDWKRAIVSMIFWGIILPGIFLFGTVLWFVENPLWGATSLAIVLIYVVQILRMSHRGVARGLSNNFAFREAVLMLVAKFAHFAGAASFFFNKFRGRQHKIIEYKA